MAVYSQPRARSEKVLTFGNLKGVDFFNAPLNVDPSRASYAQNFISSKNGNPIKRFGYERLLTASGRINGGYVLKTASETKALLHAGDALYEWDMSANTLSQVYAGMADARSVAFQMNTRLWIFDGLKALCYAEFVPGAFSVKTVEEIAYIPTTLIGRAPNGGGTRLDDINLMSSHRINSFAGTSGATAYQLDATDVDSIYKITKLNGGTGEWDAVSPSGYTLDKTTSTVTFTTAPGVSPVPGEDNVRIEFVKVVPEYTARINNCTIFSLFGLGNHNQAFVSGNSAQRNADWCSEINDPTYYPDAGYALAGQDNTAIMGYLKIGEHQAVVKEGNNQDSTVFLRSGHLDSNGVIQYSLKQGVGTGAGAVSRHCFSSVVNDPVFLAKDGVFSVVTNALSAEKNVWSRSSFVNPLLTTETNLSDAVAVSHRGFYYLCVNGRCYVADSNQRTSRHENFEYEWYYWTNIPARVIFAIDNELYFGTSDGKLMRFYRTESTSAYNDDGAAIDAYWDTPEVDFGTSLREKTIQRVSIQLRSYSRSGIELYIKDDGVFALVDEERLAALGFGNWDFNALSFLPLTDNVLMAFKVGLKKIGTTQFRFRNAELNEPFGLYECSARYEVKGNVR